MGLSHHGCMLSVGAIRLKIGFVLAKKVGGHSHDMPMHLAAALVVNIIMSSRSHYYICHYAAHCSYLNPIFHVYKAAKYSVTFASLQTNRIVICVDVSGLRKKSYWITNPYSLP